MKKILALTLAMLCLLAMTACSSTASTGTSSSTIATTIQTKPEGVFYLHFNDQFLVPGQSFPREWLPEPVFTQDAPEQINGAVTRIYFYDYLQITAYESGNDEMIYSIVMLRDKAATIPTTEGMFFGDDVARVEELYGTNAKKGEYDWTYTKGKTQMILQFDELDQVSYIEYRKA